MAAPRPPTRELTLNHGEHHDSTLYRFDKGYVLRFRPGPSLLGRTVSLYTNYVVDGPDDAEFVRNQYYELEWRRLPPDDDAPGGPADAPLRDTDACCELRLARAGAYHYYWSYAAAEGPQGSGWFQVLPELRAAGARLPLDAVMCQTVVSKCLGPLPRWRAALQVARDAGYNMLHFTPVQRLGASGSAYSIADQLRVDSRYDEPAAPGRERREASFADVEAVAAELRADWGVLSICDVVLNHTANETPWLREHPEATYNCRDCPHLRPAALLDAALARLSRDVAAGALQPRLPAALAAPEHLDALRDELARRLPALRLHELFQCDAPDLQRQFCALAKDRVPPPPDVQEKGEGEGERALRLRPDPLRRRLRATVDMALALRLYGGPRAGCPDDEARAAAAGADFRRALDALNAAAADAVAEHLRRAADNVVAGVRYERLAPDGPLLSAVSARHPLTTPYFLWPTPADTLPEEDAERTAYGAEGALVQAHNGWVMAADPLVDFAAPDADGRVYLRRELIAWGDSVKLRYGARPEDCPFLWAHMRRYVELTARAFDGLRLDNCHSTPLHVAEWLLDRARAVRPELYVTAELFTDSDHVDNIFVNRLGITSLIREAQAAWDAHELGRLVHRFGGRAVGAFLRGPGPRPASARVAHAMFLDVTHDNRWPLDARCVYDALPTAALVAMAACATGSTRGLDELAPHQVHVVDETRLYAERAALPPDAGMLAARAALNRLHAALAADGYCEVYVDQMHPAVVAVTRHHPRTRRSVVLVAATAFGAPDPAFEGYSLSPLRFEGQLDEILFEAELRHQDEDRGRPFQPPDRSVRHPDIIDGLKDIRCRVRRAPPLAQSHLFAGETQDGSYTELRWRGPLPPGSVVAVRVSPRPPHARALEDVQRQLDALARPAELDAAFAPLELADLNALLYRCDAEERDAGGGGAYEVPGHGPLVYAGLQGVASLLDVVRAGDDLGHPLCANLRAGDWLAEHTWRRLEREPRLAAAAARVRAALEPLRALPRFLQPAYADALLAALHAGALRAATRRLAAGACGDSLARALALTSVQLLGAVRSAPLPGAEGAPSMSAGLPHFATGYMRCWGRDTFIALRGLLLLPGRAEDARAHIRAFGGCLRHGLIPNLLDGGARARYNCRDAVWWWLYSIKQYCEEVEGGMALLEEPVARLFPRDDSEPGEGGVVQPLRDVMQEALDAHFQGRVFRERNAGPGIDAHMTDAGFTVQLGVQPDTGFVFGGNDHNAGTWMDKMGSSARAGTRGRPATPRDGAAVELVGLCYAAVAWLQRQHAAGRYPYAGVTRTHADGARTAWTWAEWAARLRASFERHFWVPPEPSAADARPDLVHRRAVYKDTHGATRPWADYQLRCNYVVAMVVAPDLFSPRHAWLALDAVEEHLLGPLGLKTLDPADWAYRPDYDNANDSDDPSVAHGYNYHQGPEWLWPLGYYLRARLLFAPANGQRAAAAAAVLRALGPLAAEIRSSPWRGLPELSNAGGAHCAHSCRSQAWSSAVVLEVLAELRAARAVALD